MAVKPIPDGYHSVTPYLTVQGAARLLEFLKHAFDAKVTEQIQQPNGTIGHAEVRIGDSVVMIADARGEWKPMPSAMYLYVDDADATYQRALQAGATSMMEPADQFYGDRHGGVTDPFGNFWWIATHVEDVSPDELARRAEAFLQQQARG
jgi:PhnB protein